MTEHIDENTISEGYTKPIGLMRRDELVRLCVEQQREIERLRNALRFYADADYCFDPFSRGANELREAAGRSSS